MPPTPALNKMYNGRPLGFDPYGLMKIKDPMRWMKRVSVHSPNVVATIPKFYVDPCVVVNLPVDESINLNLPPEELVDVVYPVNVADTVPSISMRWENYNVTSEAYELSEEYKTIIRNAFKYKFGELMFHDPPFS